ncbi:MAG TPA: hypothetical protein VFU94_10920 [Conexibacter sp.]|nr:hypothetical protein [Conexibacter sp.]
MQRKLVSALVAGALVVGMTACGGSQQLSPAAFKTQANAACKQTRTRLLQIAARAHGVPTPALGKQALAVMDDGRHRLAAVHPPHALSARFSQFNALLATEQGYVERELRGGRMTAAQRAARHDVFERIGPAARSLGLPDCV